MTDVVLVVNSGSSSLKFALYPIKEITGSALVHGKVTGIGRKPELYVNIEGEAVAPKPPLDNIPVDATHEWLIAHLLERLTDAYKKYHPVAAGHRIVHGGHEFTEPVAIDGHIRAKLETYVPFAPSHQPHNLSAIDALTSVMPDLLQVACFDTSFHTAQERVAKLYAIPRSLTDEGIIRYGFHGLSYEYIASALPDLLCDKANGRVIAAHLGNGASMCAMRNMKSVSTSMGFTALDGLVMGRRCGSLDPGVVLHMIKNLGMSVDEVEQTLYQKAGLLGVSELSNNMQVLLESDDPRAKEAVDLFCYRAVTEIGALAATLEGLDAIVFTAGIGENAADIRAKICAHLAWLGLQLDENANASNDTVISAKGSEIDVLVIPTDEELIIARHTASLREAVMIKST